LVVELEEEVRKAVEHLSKVEEVLAEAMERYQLPDRAWATLNLVREEARSSREWLEELLEEERSSSELRSELEVLQAWGVREKQRYGSDVRIVKHSGLFRSVQEVEEVRERVGADVVVPVLPLTFVQRLCQVAEAAGFTVLYSEMKLIHDNCPGQLICAWFDPHSDVFLPGRGRINRHYRFQRFRKLLRVELVFEEE